MLGWPAATGGRAPARRATANQEHAGPRPASPPRWLVEASASSSPPARRAGWSRPSSATSTSCACRTGPRTSDRRAAAISTAARAAVLRRSRQRPLRVPDEAARLPGRLDEPRNRARRTRPTAPDKQQIEISVGRMPVPASQGSLRHTFRGLRRDAGRELPDRADPGVDRLWFVGALRPRFKHAAASPRASPRRSIAMAMRRFAPGDDQPGVIDSLIRLSETPSGRDRAATSAPWRRRTTWRPRSSRR